MSDYRIEHRAPSPDALGHPITDAEAAFGPDLLAHPDWYGTADEQTMEQLRAALDGAEYVRIYRAVPTGVTSINPGDWVTLSRAYAHDHGWHEDAAQTMPVVAADVPVALVYTDGNDPSEWGYVGEPIPDLTPMAENDPEIPGVLIYPSADGETAEVYVTNALGESLDVGEVSAEQLADAMDAADPAEAVTQTAHDNTDDEQQEAAAAVRRDTDSILTRAATDALAVGAAATILHETTQATNTSLGGIETAIDRVEELRTALGVSASQMTPAELATAQQRAAIPVAERAAELRQRIERTPFVDEALDRPSASESLRADMAPHIAHGPHQTA